MYHVYSLKQYNSNLRKIQNTRETPTPNHPNPKSIGKLHPGKSDTTCNGKKDVDLTKSTLVPTIAQIGNKITRDEENQR